MTVVPSRLRGLSVRMERTASGILCRLWLGEERSFAVPAEELAGALHHLADRVNEAVKETP